LVKEQVGELELAAKMGVDIIAIRRNKEWIINPRDDETIKEGDVLIARGAPLGIKDLEDLAEGTLKVLEG